MSRLPNLLAAKAGPPRLPAPLVSRRALLVGLGVGALSVGGIIGAASSDSLRRTVLRSSWPSFPGPTAHSTTYFNQAQPPNIVLVTIDTLRADQLGSYGHPYMKTPALDAVASAGARFLQHQVQEPQTNPSHASLFSGMYPSSSGVRVHGVDRLPSNLASLASLLSDAGYQTAGLYSWVSFADQYSGFQRGFQVYRDLSQPLQPGADPFDLGTRKGRADQTTDAAIAQLRAFSPKTPYLLWVHYFDPHYPYQPPDNFARVYDRTYQGQVDGSLQTVAAVESGSLKLTGADLQKLLSLYQAEITFLDSQITRLFQELDSSDQAKNTVVVVTGDHGESMGEHADLNENGDYFHPHSLYDTEQRVPLLLRYPGQVRAGVSIQAPSQAVDVLPTILELSGLPVPDQVQGASLLRLLDGSASGTNRAAYSVMPDSVFTSITCNGWKLIQNNAGGGQLLFDLIHDPGEQQDQLAAWPDAANDLTGKLQGWMKAVKI